MSTLRISNIEAKADNSSPTVDEQLKFTNSTGDLMLYLDGRTSGITTVGINTTNQTIKFDANNNVMVTGIITATEFHGTLAVGTSVTYGDNEKAYFGNGLDLQIYHDTNNSYIKDQGTGQLVLDGNAVILQYSASTKLETTNTGAVVTGILTATTFSGSIAASNVNSGTLADARIPNLNASKITAGTVATARLGSGTANSSTFLRGDQSWAAVTSTTINNNADNRIITGSGTANTLEGEANLTFDGTNLDLGDDKKIRIGTGNDLNIYHQQSDNNSYIKIDNGTLFLHLSGSSDGLTVKNQGGTELWTIKGSGNIEPGYNNFFSIGDTGKQVNNIYTKNLYVGDDIIHNGDTDTKIVFTDNQIDLQTGGSSRMYATNSAIYVKSGLPLAFLASSGATPNIKSGGTNNQDLLFTSGSGNPTRLQITSDGKVGINQNTPTHHLHVHGTGNTGGARFNIDHTTTTVSGNTASGAFPHNILVSNYNNSQPNNMATIGFDIPATTGNGNHANAVIVGQAEDGNGNCSLQFWTERQNTIGERLRIASNGVATFSGNVTVGYDTTYSPIQQAAKTWYYTRADQAGSVSGSNIQNLATSSIKVNETIPISNMSRQSDAGAHSIYNSSSTSGSVSRDMSSADPFHPKAHGLTMGTLFRAHTSGNNGSGVIHYGANSTSEHFYIRYKYSSVGLNIGCDTNGSDVWTTMYQNDLVSDNNWYFVVIAVERNGTLLTSLNGAPLTPIRMLGTAPSPGNARFGLAGDPYSDNDSRHRYATAWWYKGVISNELIAQEYAWLKTIWTGASLP